MAQGLVFVYDREIFYRSLVEDILKEEGYNVIVFKSLNDFMSQANKVVPDLLIADIAELGDRDVDFFNMLKKVFPTLPFIAMVSSDRKELVPRYIRLGVFDCIEKPVVKEELILSAQKAIDFSRYKLEEKERLTKIKKMVKGTEKLLYATRKSMLPIQLKYPGSMLVQSILDSIVIAFDAEKVSLSWLDREKNKYTVVACAGYCMDIKLFKPRAIGEGIIGYVAEKKEAIFVSNILKDERFRASTFKDQYKSLSFMCAPIILNNEVVAVLSVSDRKVPKPYTEEDFVLFKSFVTQITFALESSSIITQLENSFKRLNIYKELSSLIIEIVDSGDILNRIMASVTNILNASGSALYVIDENKEYFLCEGSSGLNFKNKFVYNELLNKFLESSQNNKSSKALFNAVSKFFEGNVLHNFASYPIYMKNFPLGFLLIINLPEPVNLDNDIMQDICRLVSVAFKNNWLYKNLCITADELVKVNKELEEANLNLLKQLSKGE